MSADLIANCYSQAPTELPAPDLMHSPDLYLAGRYTPAARLIEYRDFNALPHEFTHYIEFQNALSEECKHETIAEFGARIVYLERKLRIMRSRNRLAATR